MSIILKNSTLNITEADIVLCSDMNLLLDWKIKIDAEINSIKMQIEQAKINYQQENKPSDKKWLVRATAAKKFHGQFSQLIQNRLQKLRIERNEKKQITHDREFVIAAKKILSKELFLQIVDEVNYITNNELQK